MKLKAIEEVEQPLSPVDEIVSEIASLTRQIAVITFDIKDLIRQEIELARRRAEKERELDALKIGYHRATKELMDEH